MRTRLELDTKLREVLGIENVYFQPPRNITMRYPCVRYKLVAGKVDYANDKTYNYTKAYDVMIIDKDPESSLPDKLLFGFPMCSPSRPYVADNLHHFPFTLYF